MFYFCGSAAAAHYETAIMVMAFMYLLLLSEYSFYACHGN